jgi:putative NADPH-quinone reductase
MRVLLVYCHPVPESYCAAVRDAAIRGLTAAGHEVDLLDL